MNWPEGYTCRTCGQYHTGVPFSFAADFPDQYANLSKEERDSRATIGSDQCIVDSQWFYLRGMVEIPIIGSNQPFLWGVWLPSGKRFLMKFRTVGSLKAEKRRMVPIKEDLRTRFRFIRRR